MQRSPDASGILATDPGLHGGIDDQDPALAGGSPAVRGPGSAAAMSWDPGHLRRSPAEERLPTGYMGAEMCEIQPGDVAAVGAVPVGQFAMDGAPQVAAPSACTAAA